MSEENEEDDESMTFEDAVLKELSLVKDLILKEDYLTDVVTKAVGTPLTIDDVSKAVGGSALITEQQETANLVKSVIKQLTSMQETQSGLVKSIAALQKQVPETPEEEEKLPGEEEIPEEEKQVPETPEEEEKLPGEEEEKQVPEIPEEEEKLPGEEEEKQVPETPKEEEEEKLPDEEDLSKMITKDTSWEEVHTLAKKVRAY